MKEVKIDENQNVTEASISSQNPKTKNEKLNRENKDVKSIIVFSSIFISLDVWRQIFSYGIRYYNNGTYALPQTLVVWLAEVVKLVICAVVLAWRKELSKVKISYLYAIPAVIYAVNSNIYYVGLRYTAPPVWNILTQQRLLLIAAIYRIRFGQTIPAQRWIGLILIISGILAIGGVKGVILEAGSSLITAFLWSAAGSIVSVTGSIVVEYLMKNDSRPFVEMQLQFYLFGMIAAFVLAGLEGLQNPYNITDIAQKWERPTLLAVFLIFCILLSAISGIATGVIVKKLDNIVKLYTQAVSNVLTSIACAYIYPDMFSFDLVFIISLVLIIVGITLYENKKNNKGVNSKV